VPARVGIEDRAGIRVLTLDHPARKNALDPGAIEALHQALRPEALEGVRVLLLRGAGQDAFCAGYDLNALAEVGVSGALPDDALEQALNQLASAQVPSIALVHGPAFGAGCDLACACDLRVGSDAALFCMPPARLGVVYAASGMARLASIVGLPRAKRMFFTGKTVPAEQAQAWGLLDERAAVPEAERLAWELAETISRMAPLAVQGMKRTFAGAEPSVLRALRREAFASEDAREGKAAFLEKRRPVFKGK
jgi:enoyl-CoA hydratase/carnithine racemase